MIRRLREYYRQFEELSPDEISTDLRARRDAERASALAEVLPLDLSTPAWHEPPDPEAVNAATYALRRAVNTYPDDTPLREAIAARHGVTADQVAPGHGAGELLHAAFRAIGAGGQPGTVAGGESGSVAGGQLGSVAGGQRGTVAGAQPGIVGGGQVAIAWPGWGPLPRLVHEAGGVPVPVPLTEAGAPDPDALAAAVGPGTTAVALCTPNDPTGAAMPAADLLRLAEGLDERVWLIVDAALADFEGGQTPLSYPLPKGSLTPLAARERLLVVRSFSKAHAMAGFRAGYALANDTELVDRLSPAGGVSAPAQAAMLWAIKEGDPLVARRRAAAARERQRLADALRDTPFHFPNGDGHLAWLGSTRHSGEDIARGLAARRIYVAPGTAWGDDLHVRVALRDGAATDRLVAALNEL